MNTSKRAMNQTLLLGFGLLLALILNWIPHLDDAAQAYLSKSMADNLVIFASARIINALISVIQSVEVSLSLGAGIAVNLGEALDPLNDLIERFSGFVLFGLAGLGLQQMVLVASASLLTKVLTSIVLIAGFLIWMYKKSAPLWFKRLLLLFLLVRFAFAIEVGVSWLLDKAYFDAEQAQATSALDLTTEHLQNIKDQYVKAIDDKGIFGSIWETARAIIGGSGEQGIADITASAIVQLIVIILVRSILLPMGFLWLLFYAFRRVLP